MDEIVEKYKIDKDRIYVTGLSMGGFGTWSLAAHPPNRFAAIVPICGGGEPIAARYLTQSHLGLPWGERPVVPLAAAKNGRRPEASRQRT